MVLLEAAFAFGLLGLITYLTLRLLTRPAERGTATRNGRWLTVHYDADGETRFMAAMAAARERQALFEAEED